jgi:signal transduction histidine kinase/ligand-binding sensor domain-containing protein
MSPELRRHKVSQLQFGGVKDHTTRRTFFGSIEATTVNLSITDREAAKKEWKLSFRKLARLAWFSTWLVFHLYSISAAWAQHNFDIWTADNGLPQSVIGSVLQTQDGYLWIATLDGLARFDGVHFTVFNKSNTPGLTTNRFDAMYQDQAGNLWFGTEVGGVTRYCHGQFQTYGREQGIPGNIVRGITGDKDGHVWILTADTIAEWNENSGRFVDITPKGAGLKYQPFQWDEAYGFWKVSESSFESFVGGRSVTYALPPWLLGNLIWGAAREQDGTIWIELIDGRHARADPDGKVSGPYGRIATSSYLDVRGHHWDIQIGPHLARSLVFPSSSHSESIAFRSMYTDKEQNLWLGSDGHGLYRFQEQSIQTYSVEEGLNGRNVYPIYQDPSGAIWIGAWYTGMEHSFTGLSRFYEGKFTSYKISDRPYGQLATAILMDHEGHLWLGTHGGLRVYEQGQFRLPTAPALPAGALVQAMYQDHENTLWFGTSAGLVSLRGGQTRVYTAKDGLAADDVRVIVENAEGDLWIGGYGGLTRLHNGQFTHWTESDGLPSNNVRTIYIDGAGVVWTGTYDGGLGRFKDGRFVRYTTRDGLFDNGVFQILEDGHGNFWMSCNHGIYRVSKQELNEFAEGRQHTVTSIPYGKVDGMRNVECNGGAWPAGIRTRDGKLWFPTQDGVAVIDPATVSTNTQPPPVVIEAFVADRLPVSIDSPAQIAPGKENLEIRYTALSFIKPEQIRFRYKLQGLDSNWIDAGQRRTAYYSHVPPGKYTFQVIAENNDGVWNEQGATARFTVLPAFYQTAWFRAFSVLAGVGILWLLYAFRVRNLATSIQARFDDRLEERERIARDLHDTLLQGIFSASIHFDVANNRLPADSPAKPSVQRGMELLTQVSKEGRNTLLALRTTASSQSDLEEALSRLRGEFSLPANIDFRVITEGEPERLRPLIRDEVYLIAREAVINAFRHSAASAIEVKVGYISRNLRVSVRDNGCGIDEELLKSGKEGHWGLTNMRERAERIGGRFKVLSRAKAGTVVRLWIPGKLAFERSASNPFWSWLTRLYSWRSRRIIAKSGEEPTK